MIRVGVSCKQARLDEKSIFSKDIEDYVPFGASLPKERFKGQLPTNPANFIIFNIHCRCDPRIGWWLGYRRKATIEHGFMGFW